MSFPQSEKFTRANCAGLPPLEGQLEPWIQDLAADDPGSLVSKYGSPLNVINTQPFRRNVIQLRGVAKSFGIDFDVFFARKANKCISFVREMKSLQGGIDVASLEELVQVLDVGVPAEKIICTAAVKSRELIALCVEKGVVLAIDNRDEYGLVAQRPGNAKIALRVSGFDHNGATLNSRFGFPVPEALLIGREKGTPSIVGVHFHLDGYDPDQRVSAILQSLQLTRELRRNGHPVDFIDMGGGFPVCYLEKADQWQQFWDHHRNALVSNNSPVTYKNHPLGLQVFEGQVYGRPNTYTFFQEHNRQTWLTDILKQVHREISDVGIELRCEPGRALLDGAGCTIARVEFVKPRANSDGEFYIGLSMNRTQCRTGSDDFLIDPLVVKSGSESSTQMEGYLVGAYCTESELIFLRKFRFPSGIQRGDLVVIPNTAGYFMHFLESRSHQFPLAKNYQIGEQRLDDIDCR
ncbi:MAG: Y4yA family PLP-dependent enzyme [Verrucomicrobiales bacterium]|nr:Y4yA family PLP-dependent enzyme [Verrucomicrobiales bacterium]